MKQLTIVLMALVCAFGASAQTDNAKYNEELNKLIEATVSPEYFQSTIETQFQPMVKGGMMTQENLSAMCADITKEIYPSLIDEVKKLYAENFTYDEVKDLYKFVSSPLGQKNIKVSQSMMSTMSEIGQDPEIVKKIQAIMSKYMK